MTPGIAKHGGSLRQPPAKWVVVWIMGAFNGASTRVLSGSDRRHEAPLLRVLHVVSEFPSTSQTFIRTQLEMLADLGVDNHLASRELDDRSERFPFIHAAVQWPRPVDPRAARWRSARERWRQLPGGNRYDALRALWALRTTRTEARTELWRRAVVPYAWERSPNIVHAHFGYLGLDAVPMRASGTVSRLVTSFHGYDVSGYIRRVGDEAYGPLFEEGDLFLPVSELWAHRLVELGCPPERVTVHRMGLDLSRFPYQPSTGRPNGKASLVSVGRLVKKKGFDVGISAVASLVQEGYDPEYRIAGDGPLGDELRDHARQLGVLAHVDFLGELSHEAVIRTIGEADVLLVPSYTTEQGDMEGIPMVTMEAMALGVPVVATDHSGIGELVEDGNTGFLVPERDVTGLATAVRRVLDADVDLTPMISAARERIERHHDARRLAAKLIDHYTHD